MKYFNAMIPEIEIMIEKEFNYSKKKNSNIASYIDVDDLKQEAQVIIFDKIVNGVWKQFFWQDEKDYMTVEAWKESSGPDDWDEDFEIGYNREGEEIILNFSWDGCWNEKNDTIHQKRVKVGIKYIKPMSDVMEEIINLPEKGNGQFLDENGRLITDLKKWIYTVGRNAVVDLIRKLVKEVDTSVYRTTLDDVSERKTVFSEIDIESNTIFSELNKDITDLVDSLGGDLPKLFHEIIEPSKTTWDKYVEMQSKSKRKKIKDKIPLSTLCTLLEIPPSSKYKLITHVKRFVHVNYEYKYSWKEMEIKDKSQYLNMVSKYKKGDNSENRIY